MRRVCATAWGMVGIESDGQAVTRFFLPESVPENFTQTAEQCTLLDQAEQEVREYYEGERKIFSLPVAPAGTDFMQSVWQYLCTIPYGQLQTYGDVAKALRNPGASRAVGMACANNPIPLIIPCHRVVGSGNTLTGFSGGGGVGTKQRMIEWEMGGLFARK